MMQLLVIDKTYRDPAALYADLRRAVATLGAGNPGQRGLWIVAYADDDIGPAFDDTIDGGGMHSVLRAFEARHARPLPSHEHRRPVGPGSIRALEATSEQPERTPVRLRAGSIDIDCSTGQCWRDGVEVRLSDREFAMLKYLLRSNGAVVSKFDLMMLGHYGSGVRSQDHFDTDMYRLRRKVQASDGWPAIHLVRGGFQIVAS